MSQARYHDRMKIRAHLRDLSVYRNLQRPLLFLEDIWNAFYQSEVQLKAARQLKEIIEQLAKARKARESGRSDRDLKALELKLVECQSVVDEVGDPPLKFFKATERVKLVLNTTHKLGQGGIPGLKAAFVSTLPILHLFPAKIQIKLLLSFYRVK
jgi:predicted RNA-binding Zn ribbon-like protein